jgi:ribosomal protein S18 acetylase RimI-like enzyme
MPTSVIVERLTAAQAEAVVPQLARLLQDGVAGGASIGYLPPLAEPDAAAYWAGVIKEVACETTVLLVARLDERTVGTVQLVLATKPNARHRAEVQKLIVLQSARRQGIGRLLMEAVEREARAERRTLLVLDTRQGDDAERLYRRLGYLEAGVIPSYARGANGALEASVFFYRVLT